FFKQTLYEEIIAPRRIRLHRQVGKALEEVYAKRLEEHAAELAEHFSHSSDPADLAKAVSYSEMAAGRAWAVYAYGEVVRLLEQALKVQEVLDPDDKAKRCDLFLGLGSAVSASGQPRRALDVELPEAFSLAEDIGDSERASRICQQTMGVLYRYWSALPSGPGLVEMVQWAERADRYAQPDTTGRALADIALGNVKYVTGYPNEGVPLIRRGLGLARRLGDADTFWWAAAYWLGRVGAPQHTEETLRLAEELAQG
ncbi:unnamed protein product, partial [marine sediment metagenome]